MRKTISLLILATLICCNKKIKVEKESFSDFDKRFHSDSIFQMSKIHFPPYGKFIDGFTKKKWSSENWEMMKTPLSEKESEIDFKEKTIVTDSLVIEKIWIQHSGFKYERHFKNINGKWF